MPEAIFSCNKGLCLFRQHAASIYSFFRFVSQCVKKNVGHFEARYEVELRYADCSHKYEIN